MLRALAANDAALSQYGLTREEFLAKTIRGIRPGEDLAELDQIPRGDDRWTGSPQ